MTRPRRPPAAGPLLLALALSCGREAGPTAASGPGAEQGGAGGGPRPTPASFDHEAAWRHLERIVAFGPRPAGTPSLERMRSWLEGELSALGLEPRREAFPAATPIGELSLANVVVELPGRSSVTIVLGSHMDTKRLPFPFVGANDGGSSSALLLELARVLAEGTPHAVTYRLVWFDGEESIRPQWSEEDSLYGSRHHVERLRASGELERVGAMVLFDLVADRDLRFERDLNSTLELVRLFQEAAGSLGRPELFARWAREILDDHLPFRAAGVPVIDLIDLEYGPDNAWWHSPDDVLEKCSAESLGATGALFLAAREPLEAWVLARRP